MYAASPVFIYFGFVVHRNSGHVLFFRGICFVEKLLSLYAAFIFKHVFFSIFWILSHR